MNNSHYDVLSTFFEFPKEDYLEKCMEAQHYFDKHEPEIGKILSSFSDYLSVGNEIMHELYVRTFDVQAITTLDIGYVLFGDDYKRGELLANLNKELQSHQIDCNQELSDNLTNVLQLMSQWNNAELRAEFAGLILFPALVKMRNEFNVSHVKEKDGYYKKAFKTVLNAPKEIRLIYSYCLDAVIALLQKEFPQINVLHNDIEENNFLISLKKETTLEKNL